MDIDVTVTHAFALTWVWLTSSGHSPHHTLWCTDTAPCGCGGHLVDIFFSLHALLCTYFHIYIFIFLEISSVLCSLVSVNLNLASAAEVSKQPCWVILNFAIFAGY